jgi:hypothetical protein
MRRCHDGNASLFDPLAAKGRAPPVTNTVWPRHAQIGDAALIENIERYLVAKAEHTRLSEA